jgi:hypothetical protein
MDLWDIPTVSMIFTTKIDDRYRPGALSGLVKPGQRYEVEKVSEYEFRFRLLVPAEPVKPKLIKRGKRILLSRGRPLTTAEVDKIMEEFP